MTDEPTPGAQRAISPSTQLRSDLRTFLALVGSIVLVTVAAALWAAQLQNKVDNLIERQARSDAAQERIEAAQERILSALGYHVPTSSTARPGGGVGP